MQTQKPIFCLILQQNFAFFSLFSTKTLKMTISTSVWSPQHPNPGKIYNNPLLLLHLSHYCNSSAYGLGLQTGGQCRGSHYTFYIKIETKNKIPACQTRYATLHFSVIVNPSNLNPICFLIKIYTVKSIFLVNKAFDTLSI